MFGTGVRYKFTNLNNGSTNVNYNVNKYANNGGGSSTMSKKYGNKLNSAGARGVSRVGNFSINASICLLASLSVVKSCHLIG